MHPAPRILVLRGGAIGDFLLTLPVLQTLRSQFPAARLTLFGYPHVARLALDGGLVDELESLDKAEMARFFSWKPAFTAAQTERIQSFHLILSFLHDPDGIVRTNMQAAGARQYVYGSPMVDQGHAIDHLLKPLEQLAIFAAGAVPALAVPEHVRCAGTAWLADLGLPPAAVALHPGSGSPGKNWPLDRFLELADWLDRQGRPAFFILGDAEHEQAAGLARAASTRPVVRGRDLAAVAGVLAAAGAYVGNDSGITHLAAALGRPSVALFGPTDPDRWGPRGSHVRIVRAPDGRMDQLAADPVQAAFLAL